MRTRRGERHPNARLTTDKVYAILVWYWDDDMSQAEIARKLGVAECTVWNVINGVSWKHVTKSSKGATTWEKTTAARR